jgi:hypothetical protein
MELWHPPVDTVTELFNQGWHSVPDIAIAIPANNEEERIGACLAALAQQTGVDHKRLQIVIALNNTTDRTFDFIREQAPHLGIAIEVMNFSVPKAQANAGYARRIAMDRAFARLPSDGVLLSTDADTRPDADWVAHNLAELARGTDAVAGYVTADPDELALIEPAVLKLGAAEWEYQNLLAELDGLADKVGHDPWPKHNQLCGASIAVSVDAYTRAGGLPALSVGEDRALFNAIAANDGRIRHSLAAHVVTSARTIGRANGGMADALRTRGTGAYMCDEVLEPARHALRRARWRSQARQAHQAGEITHWCSQNEVPCILGDAAQRIAFGRLWQTLEEFHPLLAWERLRSDQLPKEITAAKAILVDFAAESGSGLDY